MGIEKAIKFGMILKQLEFYNCLNRRAVERHSTENKTDHINKTEYTITECAITVAYFISNSWFLFLFIFFKQKIRNMKRNYILSKL